ncbi:MAG: DUF2812 domain-containing protein [Peptostreptococcaceae bacterium]
MREYKKVFKPFFAGQEEKECKWLSSMSKEGYHLVNVNFASYYTFEKGEKRDYTYMIDMKESAQIDEKEYILMYEDNGLQFVDKSAQFYYFKGNSDVATIELIQSEQGRYLNRINSHKNVVLLISLINLFIFVVNSIEAYKMDMRYLSYTPFLNLFAGILCLLVYIIMIKRIKKLKEDGIKAPYKTNIKDWPKLFNIAIVFTVLIIIYGIIMLIGH